MAEGESNHLPVSGGSDASTSEPIRLNESIDSLGASLSQLVESLAGSLRAAWKSGQRHGCEALKGFAQVEKHEEQLLDLLYHEILLREEFGQKPDLAEFQARFPTHSVRLRRLFDIHGALEDGWDELTGEPVPDTPEPDSGATPGVTQPDLAGEPHTDSETPTRRWPRRAEQRAPEAPPGYVLQEELGRGGMAVVFKARQQILNRTVAIKMLHGGQIAGSQSQARFEQEAKAVAQLQHPGIVQIYEFGQHHGLPWLALEYVPGGTLQEWLRGQPLPPLEACRIVEQLARIVHYAHEQGIVHRDLKPANVLLTTKPSPAQLAETIPIDQGSGDRSVSGQSWDVKISDFGLARFSDGRSDLTATGQVIGTPSYMPPEQAAGSAEPAPAMDVYSLGAILFELLTGRPPFRGATLFDTLEQVRSDEPLPPRRLQPKVPRDLETVCLKCLQKSPDRRYRTAMELAEELNAVRMGRTILARPAGVTERIWKWIRRHPSITSLLVLVVLLSVTGIAGILIENQRANDRERDANDQRDRALRLSAQAAAERDESNRLREVAEREKKTAEQQRLLADGARAEAVIARQEAEANLDQALAAIDSLSRLGIELRSTPLQQDTSRRILDQTLQLYEQLQAAHGDKVRLRRQLISTITRAGEIRSVLRDTDEAHKLLGRAEGLLDEVLRDSPDDVQMLAQQAYVCWVHANLYKDTGRPELALALYERTLAAHNAVLVLRPDNAAHLRDKGNTLTNICAAMSSLGRMKETLPFYDEAIGLLRSTLEKYPKDRSVASELALALHDQSRVFRAMKNDAASTEAFDEAVRIREQLFTENPLDMGNRTLFMRLYLNRAGILRQQRDFDGCLQQLDKAVEMQLPVVNSFPQVFEYQAYLIQIRIEQTEALLVAGRRAEALEKWRLLADQLVSARRTFPTERQIVLRMHEWLDSYCEYLWEDQKFSEAESYFTVLTESSLWLASTPASSSEAEIPANQLATWKNNAAWFLVFSPNRSAHQYDIAESLARQAVEATPENPNHLHTLGVVLYERGQIAESRQVLTRAAAAEIRAAGERDTSRVETLSQGLLSSATEQVESAVRELSPSAIQRNPQIFIMLAAIFHDLELKSAAAALVDRIPPQDNMLTRGAAQDRRYYRWARDKIRGQSVPEPSSVPISVPQ